MLGCSSMSEREKALHIVQLVDIAQTYQIAKSPCHIEVDPISSIMMGENPGSEGVILWGVAQMLFNYYAERHLPDTIMNMSFSIKVGAINNNNQNGLSLSSYTC